MRERQKGVELEKKVGEGDKYSLDGETIRGNFSVLKSSLSFPKLGTWESLDLGKD